MKTAYQIADELEERNAPYEDDAANFIRQQEAEIEALRKSHIELERGIVKDLNQRQSAEPVAWMSNGKEFYVQKNYCPDFIPLYAHPVKELTMTDDEVMDLWNEQSSHPIDFAREILRKAQDERKRTS